MRCVVGRNTSVYICKVERADVSTGKGTGVSFSSCPGGVVGMIESKSTGVLTCVCVWVTGGPGKG